MFFYTGPEKSLVFNVPLGSSETKPAKFMHWLNEKTEYACTFESANTSSVSEGVGFDVDPTVVGHPAGVEVSKTKTVTNTDKSFIKLE